MLQKAGVLPRGNMSAEAPRASRQRAAPQRPLPGRWPLPAPGPDISCRNEPEVFFH